MTSAPRCAVHSTLRRSVDTSGLSAIKEAVLGQRYDLSITFVGDARSRTANRMYRGKDKPTNVLSFPLDNTHGEIILNVPHIERECKKFGLSARGHLRFLLIHGCLHLKGHDHGGTMEQAETKLLHKFNIR